MSLERMYRLSPGMPILLVDLGVRPADLLRRAGLPGDLFARETGLLEPGDYFALWRALEAEVGPDLPLRVARAISLEVFDPAIFAATCSPNLNVAAERIARHKRLCGPLRIRVDRDALRTTITYLWPRHPEPPASLQLMDLLFWVALTRLTTRTEISPIRITAPESPADGEAYHRYLGVGVRHGSQAFITFSAADAERPFLTANEAMWSFFEPELRRRLAELDRDASMRERVRAVLLEQLPSGQASVEAVASELAVSPRTLQRRLKKEGTSFQAVLGATRESLARHYLSQPDMPAQEISFLLGYEDPNSFYRAFRAWTGQTPEQARLAAV